LSLENVINLVNTKRNKLVLVTVSLIAFGLMLSAINIPDDIIAFADEEDDDDDDDNDKDEKEFQLVEATISDIHQAIQAGDITCEELVQAYIDRAAAFSGVCTQLVTEDGASVPAATGRVIAGSAHVYPTATIPITDVVPDFFTAPYTGTPLDFGRMDTPISDPTIEQQFGMLVAIPDAGQLNAFATLNIRGERSVTCQAECDAASGSLPGSCPAVCSDFRELPDALERAAELDEEFGDDPPLDELPMYCIPFSFKDMYDTKDMRSTAGADINYAMDAPPFDARHVAQVRDKGAIIFGKTTNTEWNFAIGNPPDPKFRTNFSDKNFVGLSSRSTWAGNTCNPYDTERDPRGTSSGSGVTVAANLVVCSFCEQTFGSCKGPPARMAGVNILATRGIMPDGGGTGSQNFEDRVGVTCRTVGDAARVFDAVKDTESGYFDSNDIYTSIPKGLLSDEPYASSVIDDVKGKPLEGIRIGVVRDYFVKFVDNDVAISDRVNDEIKDILRDKLGAELVESFDPLYPDDPEIPNMVYTFQDAFSEIMPRILPEYFFKMRGGELEFDVPGFDVTTLDYAVKLSTGEAPLSDNLNLRRIVSPADVGSGGSKVLAINKYLVQRGDERVTDMVSLDANAKYAQDRDTASSKNQASVTDIETSVSGNRAKVSELMTLILLKVMYENDIDVMVNPENTTPHPKTGGPTEPTVKGRGNAGATQRLTALMGVPEIIVPAGFNDIVFEPKFVVSEDGERIFSVTGTEKELFDSPLPFSIMFWAGPGDLPTVIKVASAYEAATQHRTPPPDFGPLDD